MLGLLQACVVVTHQVCGIIKIFDVLLSVQFRPVSFPSYQVLSRATTTSLDCSLIKKTFNFKTFNCIGIALHKNQKGIIRKGAVEKIFRWRGRKF